LEQARGLISVEEQETDLLKGFLANLIPVGIFVFLQAERVSGVREA